MKERPGTPYHIIDSSAELERYSRELEKEKSIAIDLESDSLYHFKERICLIQMRSSDKTVIVDPLKVKDISSIKSLFTRKDIQKVFHGADYDIRSLYRDFKIEINNLFDTQLASMYLGIGETSLEALLHNRFNIQLNKKYRKKDWSKRPLPAEMLSYAAMDVIYLLPLAEQLRAALKKMNRLSWVEEEAELLSKVRPAIANRGPLFQKFRGAGKLEPRSLAILESLLLYRKQMAKKKDKPLYKIMNNASLMKIATAMPSDINGLIRSGLSQKQIHMYGEELMTKVQNALQLPERDLPEYPRKKRPAYKPGVPARIKALKLWRSAIAKTLELNQALIFNNALINAMAAQNPETVEDIKKIQGIRKWQIAEFGEDILHTLKRIGHGKTRKFTKN